MTSCNFAFKSCRRNGHAQYETPSPWPLIIRGHDKPYECYNKTRAMVPRALCVRMRVMRLADNLDNFLTLASLAMNDASRIPSLRKRGNCADPSAPPLCASPQTVSCRTITPDGADGSTLVLLTTEVLGWVGPAWAPRNVPQSFLMRAD